MDEPHGVWVHKETSNHYLVLGTASDSNNVEPHQEPQVVYVSLHMKDRSLQVQPGYVQAHWVMHVRSLSEFMDRFEPCADSH